MSLATPHDRLQLPESLQDQLLDFRRRVWTIKLVEAACAAAFGVVAAFLVLFALDRVWDTPGWQRMTLFFLAAAGLAAVPLGLYRWVWLNRRLEQLARLLTRKHPHVGDQLLGVIELARDETEQARSYRLCEAAIQQVAEDARHRDFSDAVPSPKHRLWTGLLAAPALVTLGLFIACPAAASNTWARLVSPWSNTPRYTFAAVEKLPAKLIVAHGEPFAITAALKSWTLWKPKAGTVQLGEQRPVKARLKDGRYTFELPSQIDSGWLKVKIGDFVARTRIEPKLRPELNTIVAEVTLPKYLERTKPEKKDIRGGAVSLVLGSEARFLATASRELSAGWFNGRPSAVQGSTLASPNVKVSDSRKVEFRWRDAFGLEGKEPFTLSVTGREDEAPSLLVEDLPRLRVVLDSEQLTFRVRAQDDFGVKRVGLEWKGTDELVVSTPAHGDRIVAAGGPDKDVLDVKGTFTPKAESIEPQPIALRVYAEDYFPGRERVYSTPFILYVLNAEQHAVWITEQMSKWHRQSLEVRDKELQLHETNKQLRELSTQQLDRPETRRKIEAQAAAEQSNGRRLSNLVVHGEDLVKQAMRNPEIGVGHLEKWAEMLQILKDISANRMPSVADLLKQASQAKVVASNTQTNKSPMAGQNRDNKAGTGGETEKSQKPPAAVPQVADRESSQQPPGKPSDKEQPKTKAGSPVLRLPMTTLAGKASKDDAPPPDNTEDAMDEAVEEQRDLLAEFEKIADELNKVLANLEGSTLLKRLKAASRTQSNIAGRLNDFLGDTFGVAASKVTEKPSKMMTELSDKEAKSSQDVSYIMDDMQSYFERRQLVAFKTVLDDMRKQDVIGGLRQLGDDLKKESGVSIAQCEYWSDTLDRWAEDLVDPASGGT
jgi:hypothetical protein